MPDRRAEAVLEAGRCGEGEAAVAMEVLLALEGAEDSDAAELDQLTAQLRRRLLELDVDDVEAVRTGEIPPGAKPVDAVTLGALVVSMGPAAIKAVVDLVSGWVRQRPVRSVTITIGEESIALGAASAAEQQRLVELFVARHAEA